MVELMAVLSGIPMTLLITVGAFVLGSVLAVPLALARLSSHRLISSVARLAIDIARGIPPIVWLFMLYFGVSIGRAKLTAVQAGILGLGIISAGYIAEILRGGYMSVPRGQFEAGRALGLSPVTQFVRIIGPQAYRGSLPSLTTYALGLLKDSSIASTIGVAEMVFMAGSIARKESSGVTAFFIAAAFYIAVSVPIAILARHLESRVDQAGAR